MADSQNPTQGWWSRHAPWASKSDLKELRKDIMSQLSGLQQEVSDLQTAFDKLKTDVTTAMKAQSDQIATLEKELADMDIPQPAQDAIDALKQGITDFDAAINPPTPPAGS
jgi:uncharacterized protein YlxW (UPF0749 family)